MYVLFDDDDGISSPYGVHFGRVNDVFVLFSCTTTLDFNSRLCHMRARINTITSRRRDRTRRDRIFITLERATRFGLRLALKLIWYDVRKSIRGERVTI